MVTKGGIRTKLCAHCANSIAEDALKCPYCKADLSSTADPEWPTREADTLEAHLGSKKHKTSIASKAILIAGLLVFGIGVFLIGGQRQRSESQSLLEEKVGAAQGQGPKNSDLGSGTGSNAEGACPEFDPACPAQKQARRESKESGIDPTEIESHGAGNGAAGCEQGGVGNKDCAAAGGAESARESVRGCAQRG